QQGCVVVDRALICGVGTGIVGVAERTTSFRCDAGLGTVVRTSDEEARQRPATRHRKAMMHVHYRIGPHAGHKALVEMVTTEQIIELSDGSDEVFGALRQPVGESEGDSLFCRHLVRAPFELVERNPVTTRLYPFEKLVRPPNQLASNPLLQTPSVAEAGREQIIGETKG